MGKAFIFLTLAFAQITFAQQTDEFERLVKVNMHTVQLAVEDYAAQNKGKYPAKVDDFLPLMPALKNPANPQIPAVTDKPSSKPGQVVYITTETTEYIITGNDAEGNKLPINLIGCPRTGRPEKSGPNRAGSKQEKLWPSQNEDNDSLRIIEAIKRNMNYVQACVEDYAFCNSEYPDNINQVVLIKRLINPVDPAIKAVVTVNANQPGQVIYKKLSKDNYTISGNDKKGNLLPVQLTSNEAVKIKSLKLVSDELSKSKLLEIAVNDVNDKKRQQALWALRRKKVSASEVKELLGKEKDSELNLAILDLINPPNLESDVVIPSDTLKFPIDNEMLEILVEKASMSYTGQFTVGLRNRVYHIISLADNMPIEKRAEILISFFLKTFNNNITFSYDRTGPIYEGSAQVYLRDFGKKSSKHNVIVVRLLREKLRTATKEMKEALIIILVELGQKEMAMELLNILKTKGDKSDEWQRLLYHYSIVLGKLNNDKVNEVLMLDINSTNLLFQKIAKYALEEAGYKIEKKNGKYEVLGGKEGSNK